MTHSATPKSLIDQLRRHETQGAWLEHLESLGDVEVDVDLPDDDTLAAILRELGVPEPDIPDVVASRPDRPWNVDERWLFERSVRSLVSTMGSTTPPPWFPSPLDLDGLDRYFFVHVFVATLPYLRDYHRSHSIAEEDTRAILADLGRNVRVHHKRYGKGGLGVSFWLMLHFRGAIYQLGRLQFERSLMRGRISDALNDRDANVTRDDLVLSIHIPDFLGPLTPEACDASIAMAKRFFARHFPDESYEYAVCHSWLLDPQLKEYLPETSNIIHFQDRFELADRSTDADRSTLQFVFGPVPADLDELPQRSSLERAVVTHLKAGRHWQGRSGWFPLS